MTKELKGIHVLLICIGAFAIIIGANLTMLFAATGSFPGLVVKNSYVASQKWNARTEAQQALGWQARIGFADGTLTVSVKDADGVVVDTDLAVLVGRPSSMTEDRTVSITRDGAVWRATVDLAPGRWRVEVRSVGGPAFAKTAQIVVGR